MAAHEIAINEKYDASDETRLVRGEEKRSFQYVARAADLLKRGGPETTRWRRLPLSLNLMS